MILKSSSILMSSKSLLISSEFNVSNELKFLTLTCDYRSNDGSLSIKDADVFIPTIKLFPLLFIYILLLLLLLLLFLNMLFADMVDILCKSASFLNCDVDLNISLSLELFWLLFMFLIDRLDIGV